MLGVCALVFGLVFALHRSQWRPSQRLFSGSGLEGDVRAAFEGMKRDDVPLFSSCEKYLTSLPTRMIKGSDLSLYKLPFYADPKEIERMAVQLEEIPKNLSANVRLGVPYIAASTASGKTASVLPAFLNSVKNNRQNALTHYVYIAFSNNAHRNFQAYAGAWRYDPRPEVVKCFMAECLKMALEDAFTFNIVKLKDEETGKVQVVHTPNSNIVVELKDKETSKAQVYKFEKWWNSTFTDEDNILVHLDEHGMMFEGTAFKNSAALRREAIMWLARLPQISVVLTYTDVPDLQAGSSAVCRRAIAMPPIDVDAIINAHKELSILKWRNEPEDRKRERATIRFRFAANISTTPANLHVDYIWQQYLQDFANIRRRKQRLMELTKVQLDDVYQGKRKLLMVLEDGENNQSERFPRIVTLADGRIACVWKEILKQILSKSTASTVYNGGLDRMRQILTGNTPDIFSAKPLEMIYAWTLSLTSHNIGELELGKWTFQIKCGKVEYGRIFPTDNETDVFPNLTTILDENTIYLAEERKEKKMPLHPRADLFFRTQDNKLVVIDVAGTKQEKKIKRKVRRLHEMKQLVKSQGLDCYGVVLAPNAEATTYSRGQSVAIGGKEAGNLMGGLVQLLSWLQ